MSEEIVAFRKKYYGTFTIRLLDADENIIGKVIYTLSKTRRPLRSQSTLSASHFLNPVYKTKTKETDWHNIECYGITGMDCRNMTGFYDNKDDKGIIFLVDKERAEKIATASIELTWSER